MPSAAASARTSPPVAAQMSAMALLNEILAARNALAAPLDKFGGRQVGDQERDPGIRDRLVNLPDELGGPRAWCPHDAVRTQGVRECAGLAEELRVPRDLDATLLARCQQVIGHRLKGRRRARRHRGLPDDQRLAPQLRHERGQDPVQLREVVAAIGPPRGWPPDEVRAGEPGCLGEARGEPFGRCCNCPKSQQDWKSSRLRDNQ